jgi:hypothetical protein
VAGIEPASKRLTAARPYQHEHHRITSRPSQVGVAGFEPTMSCSRSTRISRLAYTPLSKRRELPSSKEPRHHKKHPAGVEPVHPPWRGSRQPLHHGCAETELNCQRTRAQGETRTHVAALRVRYPGRWTTRAYCQRISRSGTRGT